MKHTISRFLSVVGLTIFLLLSESANSAVNVSRQPIAKLSTPNAQAIPTQRYFHGEPSDEEQYLLEITNRGRANPISDMNRILASNDTNIQQAFEAFDVDIYQLAGEFGVYESKPPLAFNSDLIEAARNHSEDMAQNDFQAHVSTDGSTLADRLLAAGYDYMYGGENVFAYAYSSWHAHAAFIVDWGVPDLGHRINLLDLGTHTCFREIGIGTISETNSNTAVGPLVITQDFGYQNPQLVFITGVVYQDNNLNNFYDPGEGVADVQIMPDHGDYYAVTSLSGGFAIPVATYSDEYTLTATASNLAAMTASVQVVDENVKLDFKIGNSQLAIVTGTVTDGQLNRLLADVTVTVNPGEHKTTTNSQGVFNLANLNAGSYSLTAAREGYTFQPNNFNITLTAGQTFRTQLTATSETDSGSDTPSGDHVTGDDGVAAVGCFPPAVIVMMTLTMGFLRLSPRVKW
jgi:uncharacterized protein YkwD